MSEPANSPTRPTVGSFEDRLGTEYDLWVAEDMPRIGLRLAEVKRLDGAAREGGAFSAVFVGPADFDMGQGVFRLTAGEEVLELFLVPIGPFDGGRGYEAVFN